MLTESEMRRWASLMLISALHGNTRPEFIARQINQLRAHHGPDIFEAMLEAVLLEARRVGPGHRNGSLYRKTLIVETSVQGV